MDTVGPYKKGSSDERFKLLGELGKGGFAITYKANVLQKPLIESYKTDTVALKIPLNLEKEIILQKEVELNMRLHLDMTTAQSDNIVRYLGFNNFQGQNVMVMEYIPDGSLRDRIGEIGYQKPMPLKEAISIAKGLLVGVQVMHEAHIFHRDIKPENILMDGDTPKIIDLGIARMLGSHEQASTTRGTLYYMSPEILFDDGASFPSDIWSVGITVYEMTTGKLPFYHKSNGNTIDAIRNGKFTLPHEIRPEIPKELSNIIKRALAKDINHRYQSSQQMLHDLVSLEKGDSSVIEKELAEVNKYRNSLEKAAMVESKLRAIMAKYPNEPRAYQYLGEFLSHGMRCAEAIAVFKHGVERDTENAILHWDLAMAYLKVNKPKEVASCLEKAMSLDLDEIRKRHSATLLKRLRESKSIADSKTEEELISTIESLPLLEQKNVKAAETKLRKLVEKYPTEARTYQALGEFFNRCQRHKEAIEVFKRALKLDDKNGLIRWNLAMAYMGKGHRKKASESLKSALELGLDEGHHRHASNLLKIIERSKA